MNTSSDVLAGVLVAGMFALAIVGGGAIIVLVVLRVALMRDKRRKP